MATLKNTETEQVVEGVDAETFLREIVDGHLWEILVEDAKAVEEKFLDFIEPAIQRVEGMFGAGIVSSQEHIAAQAAENEAARTALDNLPTVAEVQQ